MSELCNAHLHFVRCIKPNDALLAGKPDAGLVLDQLRFSGMLEAVHLISSGYPGRIPFVEIHERFQGKLPRSVMRLSPGDFVRAMIAASVATCLCLETTQVMPNAKPVLHKSGGHTMRMHHLIDIRMVWPDEFTALR